MDEYRKYEPIFGSWYLSRQLGKGSFGKVFEITREEYGTTYKAALKVISVPQDEDEIKSRMTEGTDMDTISEYYEGILKEIINENELMSRLKGNSNIVSYEDHQIIPHEDAIGYDILIRMELLTPLLDRMIEKKLDEKEVVKLGIDMCRALEVCHKKNIIHRDIKPQNIFISENGDYKLGDFGIARTMEKTMGGMSRKGTYKYMAPEVFMGEAYDSTVDIYSLGIVLFTLLNGNRGPFLPAPPAKVSHNDEEEARMRRFRGEPVPAPRDAGPMLAYIIQKACAYDPKDRYRTAAQMRKDLESYRSNYENRTEFTSSGSMAADHKGQAAGRYNEQPSQYMQPRDIAKVTKRRGKNAAFITAVATAVLLIGIGVLLGSGILSSPGKVDLSKCMTRPVVSGFDGYGRIADVITVDETEKLNILSKIKDDEKRSRVNDLLNSVVYTVDVAEGLKNDSYINIHAADDSNIAAEIGMEVKGTDTSIKVEGLEPLPEYLTGAREYNGSFYKLVDDAMPWTEAEAACERQGGHLATILDAGEQEFINNLIEEEGTLYHYWLGASDANNEGDWRWVTGEKVPMPWESGFSNWCGNQPNNVDDFEPVGQDYLEIQKTRGDQGPEEYLTWTDIGNTGVAAERFFGPPDYNETKYYGYICEWDF